MTTPPNPNDIVISVESARFIGWVLFLAIMGLGLLALDPVDPKKRRGPWPPRK